MNIVIISFDEPFFIPDLFSPIVKNESKNIKGIIVVPPNNPNQKLLKLVKQQFYLRGMQNFLTEGIKYALALVKVKLGISNRSLKTLAVQNSIPCFKSESVNDTKTIEFLKKTKPDIVIVQVPEIIEPSVLKLAKIGFINKHASLLPKFRGVLPVFWALLFGERETGFTFHFVDEKLDHGNIIFQRALNVKPGDSVESLYAKIFKQAGKDLIKMIHDLENNRIKTKKAEQGKYFSFPSNDTIKKFRKLGLKFS